MRQLQLRRWLLAVAMVASTLAAMPAYAQIDSREGIALRNQIDALRQEVQSLEDQVGRRGGGSMVAAPEPTSAPPAGGVDLTAQLLVRVQQLEEQTRQLRGRIDELQNQLQRQTDDVSKRIDDLTFQLQNPEAAAAARKAALEAGAPAPAGGTLTATPPTGTLGTLPARPPGAPPAQPPRTPEVAMQEGNAALARRDYVTAETVARDVLTSSRTSPRAYDAQFLLAEAQYGQRHYSQAALAFDDAYNRARRGDHAQDSLLGLANSLTALNDKPSACQALVKLRKEFPAPRADLRAPIAAAAQRAGCR